MATSLQVRPHNRDLGMAMREVDEDLAIFLGARNGEKERNEFVQIHNFEEFDDASTSADPKTDTLLIPNGSGEEAYQIVDDDNLLNFDTGKSEHDWLYGQQHGAANQAEILSAECVSLNSEPANASPESAPAADTALQLTTSNSLDSSAAATAANKRPASSGGKKPASRAATPTGRPAKSKPARASTPTPCAPSRATATSVKPVAAQVRSSTPPRATSCTSSSKPVSRSSTPSRATPRSSTPGSKTRAPACSKPASRSATPTRKPATPSSAISSSSSSKTGSVAIKNPVPMRQTVKSRPSNPSAMLSVSHDAPQTLKKSLPRRPASASRGRPTAPTALLPSSKAKPRQKSCSPTKVRTPISTTHRNGSTLLLRSRGYSHGGGDDVNPVLMGTKMVERVVNMRKLAPPKQDEHISLENPKKYSHENSGFGRSLSNRSLDMAIRHMDIRRSVSGNLKPVATTVMSYFSSGNQSSSSQNSSFGISESPITSCSDSSKSSNGGNSYFLDGRRQIDD